MKKLVSLFSIILLVVFAFSILASSALAAGGKVRGEEGQGGVYQNCVDGEGICPFIG